LQGIKNERAQYLAAIADYLIKRSVWIMGGDGWAYDIGYGGLDHVLANQRNVNVLVLDTEVYSNTGGQASKATPLGAVAKFAAAGKRTPKKSLAAMMMNYGHIYIAQIALGANPAHAIKAIQEAESYNGPSLIIAYSHCIAHGIKMELGLDLQKMAVESGYWPLFRFDPRLAETGKNPFVLDSKKPSMPFKDYAYQETRFKSLMQTNPEAAARLLEAAQHELEHKWKFYEGIANNNLL
jgi:pyruvate-ferredoxin/flavodoxin oxidoreductase